MIFTGTKSSQIRSHNVKPTNLILTADIDVNMTSTTVGKNVDSSHKYWVKYHIHCLGKQLTHFYNSRKVETALQPILLL